jgi:hypothetical protein
MRKCPFCAEEVQAEAVFCKHCHKDLPPADAKPSKKTGGEILPKLFLAVLICIGIGYGINFIHSKTKEANLVQTYYVKATMSDVCEIPAGKSIKPLNQFDSIELYSHQEKNGYLKLKSNGWIKKADLYLDPNDPELKKHLQLPQDKKYLAEVEARIKEYREKQKKFYPTEAGVKIITEDIARLVLVQSSYEKSDSPTEKNLYSQAQKLSGHIDLFAREMYAKFMEGQMMEKSVGMKIEAAGDGKKILAIKYVLMSDVMVYQLRNNGGIDNQAKVYGFEKIIFTDGYKHKWTVKLNEKESRK